MAYCPDVYTVGFTLIELCCLGACLLQNARTQYSSVHSIEKLKVLQHVFDMTQKIVACISDPNIG
jgi:hypothetical protein